MKPNEFIELKNTLTSKLSQYQDKYPDINKYWELLDWNGVLDFSINSDIDKELSQLILDTYRSISS